MSDSARLVFAIVLGVSATAALLAGLVPLVSPRAEGAGRFDRAGAALWMVLLAAWLAGAYALANARALRPWQVAVAFVAATVLARFVGPIARPLAALKNGALWVSALRVVGLSRLIVWRDGWLPTPYATAGAAVDVVLATAAVALCFVGGERLRRAWAVVAVVTLAGEYAAQLATVRPLPMFEALHDGFLLPLLGAAALTTALTRARA